MIASTGRGFKERREDMQRQLHNADAKVFALTTMDLLIVHARTRVYRVR